MNQKTKWAERSDREKLVFHQVICNQWQEVSKSDLQKWEAQPDVSLRPRVFDVFNGAQPGGRAAAFESQSARTLDGRLWFANGAVVQMMDPAHAAGNLIPPPVHVEQVIADRKSYSPQGDVRLPARTRDVEIDYTALSFAVPQKVRFRYKLEGRDTNWEEPGTRRQAFYTDLRPGTYRFHVIACNNDGVWNETGASLGFSILPAWYQTTWFLAACALAFLLLLWIAYQLRVRQLHRQFAIGVEARVNERTRIARELHDTLLQTFHGLMFEFQAARNLLPARVNEAMQSFDEAIGDTEKALAESRDAIQDLRSEPITQGNLADLLKAESTELASTAGKDRELPSFDLIEEGERRPLAPAANSEICRIAVELLRNAFHHANASRIEAEIRYDDQALRVRIRDNGKGIDPKVLKDGGRSGHWGLKGVRERAQRIESHLDFWSNAGAGTEVELTVPAAVAYEGSPAGIGSRLIRKVRSHAQHS